MVRIAVLGAGGVLGRLVVAALGALGADAVPAGRHPAAVAGVLDVPRYVVRQTHAGDAGAVAGLCREVDALVVATPLAGDASVEAAVRAGCHHVDALVDQQHVAGILSRWQEPAVAAGVTVLPGAGLLYTVGDLLAHRALREVAAPREVHVSYAFSGPGRPLMPTSSGTRAALAGMVGLVGQSLVSGTLRPERPGEARRLAWFPRPLGLRHAAGFPGAEALTVPAHTPGVTTARTYVALRTAATELLHAAGTASGWQPAARLLRRGLVAGRAEPDPADRRRTRWACVAEAAPAPARSGAQARADPRMPVDPRGRGDVVRAWGSGRDPYASAARILAWLAVEAAAGRLRRGATSAAGACRDPSAVLDALAEAAGFRWSVR